MCRNEETETGGKASAIAVHTYSPRCQLCTDDIVKLKENIKLMLNTDLEERERT
jgi:hypothetical protein